MTIEEMKERKRELGYTNQSLSEASGVPLGTVQKLFAGLTRAPRKATIDALERVLKKPEELSSVHRNRDIGQTAESQDQKTQKRPLHPYRETSFTQFDMKPGSLLRENSAAPGHMADPRQGSYTLDDYYALPDERRVELIDGWIYDIAAPSRAHQLILGDLHLQFAACAESHPECELYFAPLDVRLDNDNYTMVQPDLLIICDSDDNDKRRINGAPDFVIEILSPSNRYHDMVRKLNKYRHAGVREYWIVDPEKRRICVYDFEHEELPFSYTFKDQVPVIISGGECVIDFSRIEQHLARRGL